MADMEDFITHMRVILKNRNESLEKAREEIKPKQVGLYGKEDWCGLVCVCPDCKAEWMGSESETHFCPNCGQAVTWNG